MRAFSILKENLGSKQMQHLIIGTHMLHKLAFLVVYWGFILAGCTASQHKLSVMDEANILEGA